MAMLGKIGVIVALIGSLAVLGLSFVIKPKLEQKLTELDNTKADLSRTTSDLESNKKQLADTKSSLEQTQTELTTTKGDLATAKGNEEKAVARANEAESKAKDLQTQIVSKDEKIAEVEKKLAEANAPIVELQTKVSELTQQVSAIEGEKKQLADKVKEQEAEISDLKGVGGDKVVLPAGLKGKVLVIEKNWNFVVIDLGRKDGVLENGELTVYRNLKFVGKVKVTAVNTRLCVANILPGWMKLDIQEGDVVIPAS